MAHYYLPLGGIIIAVVMLVWIGAIALATQREGMAYSELSRWAETPMTLPTDSLVGPRVEAQTPALQVANGGDKRLWIGWEGAPSYSSLPFYPDGYAGDPKILETSKGGRVQIEPGQSVFFPAKKIEFEGFRLAPLLGCGPKGDGLECRVGSDPSAPSPYFEFLFNPPGFDTVSLSVATGTTLPFTLSFFTPEDAGVTSIACSLPPAECPPASTTTNAQKKFVGCGGGEGYHKLLAENCLVTQSPDPQSVGAPLFTSAGTRQIDLASSPYNRFKLTFYDTGFEWV